MAYGNNLNLASDILSEVDFVDAPIVQPKFISRSQSVRAVIGDTVTLPCEVENLGEFIFPIFSLFTFYLLDP